MTFLERWQRRGDWTLYDDLWRAACWEMSARLRSDSQGAKQDRDKAAAIMAGRE